METNEMDTPMVEKSKLDADPQRKEVNPTRYRGSTSGSMQLLVDRLIPHHQRHVGKMGVVELYFVRREYQLAYIFTKALRRELLDFLINKLGMRSMSPETLKSLSRTDELSGLLGAFGLRGETPKGCLSVQLNNKAAAPHWGCWRFGVPENPLKGRLGLGSFFARKGGARERGGSEPVGRAGVWEGEGRRRSWRVHARRRGRPKKSIGGENERGVGRRRAGRGPGRERRERGCNRMMRAGDESGRPRAGRERGQGEKKKKI
ncbi:hypothetical protein Tco_0470997 [Tanacetum coccineum]